MARAPRLILPGLPHHVVQRGNNRQPVFVDDDDRRFYLEALGEVCRASAVQIHAYTLMSNHIHLLATPQAADGLARAMQALGRRVVARFNRRHGRSGTLWEGRFRASVVDAEGYFLACLRYIELNPVRAGLVQAPQHYMWSSAAHHLGLRSDPLITDHPAFWLLGNTPFEREAAYHRWLAESVSAHLHESIGTAVQRNAVLGDAAFVARVAKAAQRNLTPARRGRPFKNDQKIDSDPN